MKTGSFSTAPGKFEVVAGAVVARHTRKQSEGGGGATGRGCRDSRRRAGWHLLQEEQSTGRYHCRNGQHKMQALVDDSTWQISLPKCHTNGV
ncbi:hypothetical protein B296_00006828 [Ensete ventricosum]|uniref:Uncharacterized protein n=1 Tax=Ensete ventricosum TaxID=4639 RepID=A0A427A159_ENSVE|nr:hypothetical protein B296_00006828 [Ensete ventricosum]